MVHSCIVCGSKLIGRSDKKFCSDMCRNVHNNRLNQDVNATMRNTNNALRKNRRILDQLCPDETATVERNLLALKGYNFLLCTGIGMDSTKQVYFLYDFKLESSTKDLFTITRL